MTAKAKIKVIKKGESKPAPVTIAQTSTKPATQTIVSTVQIWIKETRERKETEFRAAFAMLNN